MGMVIPGVRYPSESLPLVMLAPMVDEPLAPWTMTGQVLVPETRGETEGLPRQPSTPEAGQVLSASEWAAQQFAPVQLGDHRLNRRALEMGATMAAHPAASLPNQMEGRSALVGAYRVLNREQVTLEALLAPHRQQTLAAAGRYPAVLLVEDTTELDDTTHASKRGLGPIGDGKGKGLLLHSTLAVVPQDRRVLGVAHAQVVKREPTPKPAPHWKRSAEAQVWEVSARSVGEPPDGVIWVQVSDRGSDIVEYLAAGVDEGKQFLVRAYHNRLLEWDEDDPATAAEAARAVLDDARRLPAATDPRASYPVHVPATKKHAAREARVVMAWARVSIPPPSQAPPEIREHAAIQASILRVWEPDPPAGAKRVEWVLISSLPITRVEEALRAVDWYSGRWLCEDYHQCLKTGCRVEATQLDAADDVCRLLGFMLPIAVRLLQVRQRVRQSPEVPAKAVVDPLMVDVLTIRRTSLLPTMTLGQFWRAVAELGGHQGRRSDGPPGWRTLWKGWRYRSDLTEGARLFARGSTS